MSRTYRIARRWVRKAIKPTLLWANAWLYKQSEEEVEFFASQRQILSAAQHRERIRQVKLQLQRKRISGW